MQVDTVFPYCQQYFIVHSQQAPTDNPLIRQAIRSVVAVDEIIAVTGGARRNHSMVYPDGTYYGGEVTDGRYDQHDPEKAKALQQEAEIGRAHVRTPVTNAHLVCSLLHDKK